MGDEQYPLVDVVAVRVVGGHVVELGFDDGACVRRDLTPLLCGEVFAPMRESYEVFCAVDVDAERGSICWPNDADIDPQVLRWDHLWHQVVGRSAPGTVEPGAG